MIELFTQMTSRMSKSALKEMIVQFPYELTSLQSPSYPHRLVWVSSEKNFYLLASGNGSTLSNWEKFNPSGSVIVGAYNSTRPYADGELTRYRGILYMAVGALGMNVYPDSNPESWLAIGPVNSTIASSPLGKIFRIPNTIAPGTIIGSIERKPTNYNLMIDSYHVDHSMNSISALVQFKVNGVSTDLQYSHLDQNTIRLDFRAIPSGVSYLPHPVDIIIVPHVLINPIGPFVWIPESISQSASVSTSLTIQAKIHNPSAPISTTVWSKVSGPLGVDQLGVNSDTISLTNLEVGTYVYNITVTDNNGKQTTAHTVITVIP